MKIFDGKRILITGGTGSLGKTLIRRLLSGESGKPSKIIVFSRDEAKQHALRLEYQKRNSVTDEVIYRSGSELIEFRIGDVRDFHSISSAIRDVDIVFNAAALKQVPTCEYFPFEAVQTNIIGAENIVRAIRDNKLKVETVVGVSTDKAVKPVNIMGMTKSIQERIFACANINIPDTRFIIVRYGNVLASRGSVIPLFHDQIKSGGPVTITDSRMTRFLMSLNDAVNVIFAAVQEGKKGETYIPLVPAALIMDVAQVLIDNRKIDIRTTGIRPGEKLHESLISEEEAYRSFQRGKYYIISSILPELKTQGELASPLKNEYSSADNLMNLEEIKQLLVKNSLMIENKLELEEELIA